ncbi:MAG: LacI family transcriptional regulator [Subdoligranulum sp.]|nr:LacI family transcriptional regulator [Subdoligranulum sp.]MBD5101872.1 LacI family transcriptional regulator [Subdoligranulum sp.]
MASIREVAALANVSVATVSRVLNNDNTYKMREETRQRVWDAIAQTGYRHKTRSNPHDAISVPMGKGVGCILSVTKDKYRDPYFMSIYAGIEQRLAQKGYSVAFLKTYYEFQEPAVLRAILDDPPLGLILMEQLSPSLFRNLRARIPVCIGIETGYPDIDVVGYDHFEAGMRITEHLISKGHRKIAFVGGSVLRKKSGASRRYLGFMAAMQLAGLPVRPEWVLDCQWDELICIDLVKALMAQPDTPTAICAASDLMAMATLSALYSIGVSVPGQVAVIGLSNIQLSQFSSPPLTTYSIPAEEIGHVAVDLFEERLQGCDLPPRKVYLPITKVVRASV